MRCFAQFLLGREPASDVGKWCEEFDGNGRIKLLESQTGMGQKAGRGEDSISVKWLEFL